MIRAGMGYDFHQLAEGERLILGGVEIPYIKGLRGHSDADVLIHAIMDALIGAAGWGDIGQHFPDTDAGLKGISSGILLKRVADMLSKKSWRIVNIDATVVLQEPRLEPFKLKMSRNIAKILRLDPGQVNIKATTTEMMDSIGRKKAASAYAAALIEQ